MESDRLVEAERAGGASVRCIPSGMVVGSSRVGASGSAWREESSGVASQAPRLVKVVHVVTEEIPFTPQNDADWEQLVLWLFVRPKNPDA